MNKILSEQKKRPQDNEKQFSLQGDRKPGRRGYYDMNCRKKAENYHEFWSLIKPCHDGIELQIKHIDIFPALDRVYYPEQLMSSHD